MDSRPYKQRRNYKYNYKTLSPYPEIQEMLKLGLISIISVLLPSFRMVTQEQFQDILEHSSFQFSVPQSDREDIEQFALENQYRGNFFDNVSNGKFRQHLYYLDEHGKALVPGNVPLSRKGKAKPGYFKSVSSSSWVSEDLPIQHRSSQTSDVLEKQSSLDFELGSSQSGILNTSGSPSKPIKGFSPVSIVDTIDNLAAKDSFESDILLKDTHSFDVSLKVENTVQKDVSLKEVEDNVIEDKADNVVDVEMQEVEDNENLESIKSHSLMDDDISMRSVSDSNRNSDETCSDIEDYHDEINEAFFEESNRLYDQLDGGYITEEQYQEQIVALRSHYKIGSGFGKSSVLSRMLNFNDGNKEKMFYHNSKKEHKLRFRSLPNKDRLYFVSHLRVGRHPDYRSKVTNFFSKYVDRRLSNFKIKSQNSVRYSFKFEKNRTFFHVDSSGTSLYDFYRLTSLVKDIRYKISLL